MNACLVNIFLLVNSFGVSGILQVIVRINVKIPNFALGDLNKTSVIHVIQFDSNVPAQFVFLVVISHAISDVLIAFVNYIYHVL